VIIKKSYKNLTKNLGRSYEKLTMTSQVSYENVQDAQLSQRDRAAGCVTVFAKSRRLELGDNILWTL